MTKLTSSLKADLPALAELLRSKGKGKDTILAHINPREAALLKKHGGSGDINPDTGLPQYDDGDFTGDVQLSQTPTEVAAQNPDLYAGGQLPSAEETTTFVPASESGPATVEYQAPSIQTPTTTGVGAGQVYDIKPAENVMRAPGIKPFPISPDTLQAAPGVVPSAQTDTQSDVLRRLQTGLGNVSSETLVKALGLGGLGLLGARNANIAGAQNQQAQAQQQAIAQPYQTQGQEMIQAAQRGELTPMSQQAYQAAQAQANQALAGRGGVGQAQVQQQMANLYNQLLQNQYTYGLNVAQIGDNIAIGAIRSGLQLDRSLQQTTQNFYTQLAAIASGSVIGGEKK
jgi:hypothetical protein